MYRKSKWDNMLKNKGTPATFFVSLQFFPDKMFLNIAHKASGDSGLQDTK